MIDRTDDPKPTALDLLAGGGDVVPGFEDDPTVFAELAFMLKDEGVYDTLDDHDGRRAVAVTLVDLIQGGSDRLRARAEWIASGEGAGPLHDPQAVAEALLRTAELAL